LPATPTNLPPAHSFCWRIAGLWKLAILISILSVVSVNAENRFVSGDPRKIANRFSAVDQGAAETAGGGGLLLRFAGFVGPNVGYTTNIFFRAVFDLYPQPVLVGEASAVINTGDDITAANGKFNPTDSWLLQHGVHAILSYTLVQTPDGIQHFFADSRQLTSPANSPAKP
jgi:hypothetical protein